MSSRLPYPGLRPFRRDETDIFFGREEQADELLRRLGASRFLAVVGPSGCGKSSLVRAGLIAGLQTGFMASAGARWRVATLRPGDHPMMRLANSLVEESALGPERAGDLHSAGFIYATLQRGPLGLIEVLRETPLPGSANLLLLVDQFEELFRYQRGRISVSDEACAFVALLLETATRREVPVYIVITMRSDYLGDCALFTGLPEMINDSQYLTPRMTRKQREAAIVGPARVFHGEVERALASRLLNDMGSDPDQLPLMQHVLMRMWTSHPGWSAEVAAGNGGLTLRVADYEAAGTLSRSLSRHADEAYGELNDGQKQIAEVMFRCLTERSPEQRDTRRPASVDEVAAVAAVSVEAVIEVAESFRRPDRSFITPSIGEALYPNTTLDISHESLIRCWDRLNDWVAEEAHSAWIYRRLEETSRLWDKGQAALWRTPDLENGMAWRTTDNPTPEWAQRYGGDFDLAMRFLRASHDEKEQQLREAGQAARRKQQLKWFRRFSFGVGTMFLAAVAFGILAYVNWDESRDLAARLRDSNQSLAASRDTVVQQRDSLQSLTGSLQEANTDLEETNQDLVVERNRSQRLAGLSRSRMLATRAQLNLDLDPELSMLLATQSAVEPEVREMPEWSEVAIRRALRGPRLSMALPADTITAATVAFSPDGSLIATGGAEGSIKIWDAATGDSLASLTGHASTIVSLAFHPDGLLLASASLDGYAGIWDITSGEAVTVVNDQEFKSMWSVAFSPDGDRVVTGSEIRIVVWDIATGDSLRALKRWSWEDSVLFAYDVVYSPDGKWIGAAGADSTIRLWSTYAGDYPQSSLHRTNLVYDLAFSGDGKRLLATDKEHVLILTVGPSGAFEDSTKLPHGADLATVAISPDGRLIATAGDDDNIKVWDAESGIILYTLSGHSGTVWRVAFSEDGRRLASASFDGDVRVWDIVDPSVLLYDPSGKDTVLTVAFSGDGKRIATAGTDRWVRIWDTETRNLLITLRGHVEDIISVEYSRDGQRITTAGLDDRAKVWDAGTADELLSLEHGGWVTAATFSPDGQRIATASLDTTAKIWDAATGELLLTLRGHTDWVSGADFSPDGGRLATSSGDRTVKVWDVSGADAGDSLFSLTGHSQGVRTVRYSPDGSRLATGSYDGTAKIWEAATGEELFTLRGHTSAVRDIAFDAEAKRLATASLDSTATIWDLASRQMLVKLDEHEAELEGIAFSPDDRFVATVSRDGTARIWDAETGDSVMSPHLNVPGWVRGVAFSPTGQGLATGDQYGTLRIWDLDSGAQVVQRSGHTNDVWGVAFSPDGSRIATTAFDGSLKIWAASTGQEIHTLYDGDIGSYGNFTLEYPDEGTVIVGGSDGYVRIWDPINGVLQAKLESQGAYVFDLGYSSDGELLAAATGGSVSHPEAGATLGQEVGTAVVWNRATREQLYTLPDHGDRVYELAFSADRRYLATGTRRGMVYVWHAADGDSLLAIQAHTDRVSDLAFSRDSRYLVTTGLDGYVKFWDLDSGDPLLALQEPSAVWALALSTDGDRFVTAGGDGSVRIHPATVAGLWREIIDRVTRIPTEEQCKALDQATCDETLITFIVQARRLAEAGDVAGASDLYRKATSLSPAIQIEPEAAARRVAAQTMLARGRHLARAGEANAAIELFQKSFETDPRLTLEPEAEVKRIAQATQIARGLTLARIGAREQALLSLSAALTAGPKQNLGPNAMVREVLLEQAEIRFEAAETSARAEAYGKAFEAYQAALEYDDGEKRAHILYWLGLSVALEGLSLLQEGQDLDSVLLVLDSATSVYETLGPGPEKDDLARRIAETYLTSSYNLWVDQDKETSVMLAMRAIEVDSTYSDGYIQLGYYQLAMEHIEDAAMSTRKALQISPNDHIGNLNYGYLLFLRGDLDRGLEHLKHAYDRTASMAAAVVIGDVYAAMGAIDQATHWHEAALDSAYDQPEWTWEVDEQWVGGTWIYNFLPEREDDRETILRYVEFPSLDSKKAYAHYVLSLDLALAGQFEAADSQFSMGLELAPPLSYEEFFANRIRYLRGVLSGESPQTRDWLVAAENTLAAAHSAALIRQLPVRVDSLSRSGQMEEALVAYEQAREGGAAFDATQLNSLCWFGSLRGYAHRVLEACEDAVSLDPGNANIRDSRGVARALTGDFAGAIEDFVAYVTSEDYREDLRDKRRHWISELRAGRNPFTAEVLASLLEE